MNKLRAPIQILLSFILGLFVPFCLYVFCDAQIGIDISGWCYVFTVIILVATALVVWVECALAVLFPTRVPEEPASPYPPASAIIAAYLPNEADTILETIEAFLNVEYPAPLQVRKETDLSPPSLSCSPWFGAWTGSSAEPRKGAQLDRAGD